MLLIASILLATTTYAWYVLSTAPEVTGITTTVGSNGALEIALVSDLYTSVDSVPSSTGDSIAATSDATQSNITWGNLIDLSDEAYGFGAMTLNLAASSGGTSGLSALLSYPLYGADGRVSELAAVTDVASYDSDAEAFQIASAQSGLSSTNTLPSYMGVRALGMTSSTNVYQAALKTQQSTVKSAVSTAKKNVPNTLNTNMMTFMLFAYAYMDSSTTVASSTYMTLVDTLITAMENTNSKIEEAMKAAILAEVAANSKLYDLFYSTLKDYDFATLYSLASVADSLSVYDEETETTTYYSITLPTEVSDVYDTYLSLVSATSTARDNYDSLTQGTATLDDLAGALSGLVDLSALTCTLDGETKTLREAASSVIYGDGGEVEIIIGSGAGAFYTLAKLTGNYTVSYSTGSISINITTSYTSSTGALDDLQTYVSDLESDYEPEVDEDTVLSDIYGYVLDFWFRTNATSANLLLQTDAVSRIDGETDDSVQGAGSYVQFAEGTNTAIASAVKLVFLDASESVVATASITEIDDEYKGLLELDDPYTSITTLTQNEAQQISVLVYIDGTEVDNSIVSSDSDISFTLNLQFSTDATLDPMTYSSGYASID